MDISIERLTRRPITKSFSKRGRIRAIRILETHYIMLAYPRHVRGGDEPFGVLVHHNGVYDYVQEGLLDALRREYHIYNRPTGTHNGRTTTRRIARFTDELNLVESLFAHVATLTKKWMSQGRAAPLVMPSTSAYVRALEDGHHLYELLKACYLLQANPFRELADKSRELCRQINAAFKYLAETSRRGVIRPDDPFLTSVRVNTLELYGISQRVYALFLWHAELINVQTAIDTKTEDLILFEELRGFLVGQLEWLDKVERSDLKEPFSRGTTDNAHAAFVALEQPEDDVFVTLGYVASHLKQACLFLTYK